MDLPLGMSNSDFDPFMLVSHVKTTSQPKHELGPFDQSILLLRIGTTPSQDVLIMLFCP